MNMSPQTSQSPTGPETCNIGILALQGCVEPHIPHLHALGAHVTPVKTLEQAASVDGFILPGGESTTMLKLMKSFKLFDGLREQFIQKPVWGICAGAILMAREVENPAQDSFGLLPIRAIRNAYGRQLDSIHQVIEGCNVSYIRAPRIVPLDDSILIHAERDHDPVWISSGQYMITTFHPEMNLSFPSPMHKSFVETVMKYSGKDKKSYDTAS